MTRHASGAARTFRRLVVMQPLWLLLVFVSAAHAQPGPGELIVGGLSNPTALAVDDTHVYWTESPPGSAGSGMVRRAAKTGGAPETLVGDLGSPSSLSLLGAYVYFNENPTATTGVIRRVPKAGGAVQTLVSTGTICSLTAHEGVVYFSDCFEGHVRRVPVDGGSSVLLSAAEGNAWALFVASRRLYWLRSFGGNQTLRSVSIDGGALSGSIEVDALIKGFAADETAMFWANNFDPTATPGQVFRSHPFFPMLLRGGLVRVTDVVIDERMVFFIEDRVGNGSVRQIAKWGSAGDPTGGDVQLASGINEPFDPAVDATHVYWLERAQGRANLGTVRRAAKASLPDDTVAPETTITGGTGFPNTVDPVVFQWTGTDDITPPTHLLFSWRLHPVEPSFNAPTPARTTQYGPLPPGTYTLWVRARDIFGNDDPTPASRTFTLPAVADERLEHQWHLKARSIETAGANIRAAWTQSTGIGVVIGVVDDGLQRTHPDLAPNYRGDLSFDFNDNDSDPLPTSFDPHGTSVAGLAGARGMNTIGVSGAAPLAGIAGLRLISAPASDADEAAALSFADPQIAISNNSWGPSDDAMTMRGPGPMAQAAIDNAARFGRGGLGRVFVWAAGNGRPNTDRPSDYCGFDGYATQRFAMAVGALDERGEQAWYSEACPALFVVAPSNGFGRGLTTTDLMGAAGYNPTGDYNDTFGGTSGATPIVSGIVALMLQRNPRLTWRDVQEIIAQTAVRVNPSDAGWTAGAYAHNHKYGFGLVDAGRAVDTAAFWGNLPAEQMVPVTTRVLGYAIPDNAFTGITDSITVPASFANFLVEHVEVEFDAHHAWRGDLRVELTSPTGVVSDLALSRRDDEGEVTHRHQFADWKFRSVRHWGERAAGTWTLRVADVLPGLTGTWNHWRLRIWGRLVPTIASASLTSNVSAPQPLGTTVTFTASATGGLAPRQFKWWVYDGVAWRVARDWSTNDVFAWTPTAASSAYLVAAWVRSAGSLIDGAEGGGLAQMAFPITAAPAATLTDVMKSHLSPQMIGQTITFTAVGSGGITPRQYKFWLFNGTAWTVARDWSTNNEFVWIPATPRNDYVIGVWVRGALSTQDAPDPGSRVFSIPFTITEVLSSPIEISSAAWDKGSPQPPGTTVNFVVIANGGVPPVQYKWWVFNGNVWSVGRDWAPANTFAWTPQLPGTYSVAVWVRQGNSTLDAPDNPRAVFSTSYVIQGASAPPLVITGLTANLPTPQPIGTNVTFTATATGGVAPHQFKWWVWNGAAWTVGQNWSPANTFVWAPQQTGVSYFIAVWGRSAGSIQDAPENNSLQQMVFAGVGNTTPLTLTSLQASVPSPQPLGSTVTFTAVATGGTAPRQFKWWVFHNAAWHIARDWSDNAQFAWTPTTIANDYIVAAWARSAGSGLDGPENGALRQMSYAIGTAELLQAVALGLNFPSPLPLGGSVEFSAVVTGGTTPRQFKWWLFDGVVWRVAQDWSTSSTFPWRPTAAGSYIVAFWARSAGNAVDAPENNALRTQPYIITP